MGTVNNKKVSIFKAAAPFGGITFQFDKYAVQIDAQWDEQDGRQWRVRVINYGTGRYEPDRFLPITDQSISYRDLILKATGRKRLYRGLKSW